MNLNDYKDGNGNVEVSENLVGDIIDEINGVADYVIETGNNANGNWEKWNSGKLVQWGSMVWRQDNKVLTFPIPFISNSYTPLAELGSVQENDRSVSIERTSASTMTIYIFNGPTQMSVYYQVIGRWK